MVNEICLQEQQALNDRRFAALQAGGDMTLHLVDPQTQAGQVSDALMTEDYIHAASQALFVDYNSFLFRRSVTEQDAASVINEVALHENDEAIDTGGVNGAEQLRQNKSPPICPVPKKLNLAWISLPHHRTSSINTPKGRISSPSAP